MELANSRTRPVIFNSPFFRTQTHFPWILLFSHLRSVIYAAVGDTLTSQLSRHQSRRERSSGKKRELAGAREQRQIQHPWTTTSSHAATVTGSAVRGSASRAIAGAAALPRTDIYGRKLHCLPRQKDANNVDPKTLRNGSEKERKAVLSCAYSSKTFH